LDENRIASLQTIELLRDRGIDLGNVLSDRVDQILRDGSRFTIKRDKPQRERQPLKSRNPDAFDVRTQE
jgi:hypothetical protein